MGRRRSGRRRAAKEPAGSGGSAPHPAASPSTPSPPPPPPRRRPREDTPALRRRLLGLIRGFYLDVILRLPTADLRATLARGLLVGGHCYGPLHPADNIVANSVWYAAAFPLRAEDRVDADVISAAQGTDRAARRSLDRLVACLLHVWPSLSPADALWQLCRSRADLRIATAAATPARCARPPFLHGAEPEVVRAAFQVAAEAARHPDPAAFALFASSVLPAVERDVARVLVGKRGGLSSHDIDRLSTLLLMPHHLSDELASRRRPPPEPSPEVSEYIYSRKRGVIKWCNSLIEIADAALRKFATRTGLHYELHTIYGDSLLDDEDCNNYFHINFMGQPKEDHHSSSSGAEPGRPLFFFAEEPRPRTKNLRTKSTIASASRAPAPSSAGEAVTDLKNNCHACLTNKYKINHPSADPVDDTHDLRFGGQCYEIGAIDHDWNFRPTMGVDYLFFGSDRDNGLVEYLHNYFAALMPSVPD